MSFAPTAQTASAPGPVSAAVEVDGLAIRYGDNEVVRDFHLTVAPGEIVSLLGPSGCGKTTTLRAIAGFIDPAAGSVRLHGEDVTHTVPNKRNIGLVFQGYALFPHLTVFQNVAYGLRMRGVGRREIAERVGRALALVQLEGYGDRRPKQLSGGQQQRVAIARAVVVEPQVLLLDEPLSNLDAKLRQEMRIELRRLLKTMGVAAIFVTHDQEEAIILSDRILLMNGGRIEQEGHPREMYRRPRTLFAAAFFGQANFLDGTVTAVNGDTATVDVGGQAVDGVVCGPLTPGAPATVVVKCERVAMTDTRAAGTNHMTGRFEAANFLGATVHLQCTVAGQSLVGVVPDDAGTTEVFAPGGPIALTFPPRDTLIFPRASA